MEGMDSESFNAYFGEERMWTATLSNGSIVPLRPGGQEMPLLYSDRKEYCSLVQQARLTESDAQVVWIQG